MYGLHFDGIVGLRDRVQVGQVHHRHGRLFLQNATELDVETVGGHGSGPNADGGGGGDGVRLTGGDGHDLGLRIPVVAYVVGHGHAAATASTDDGGRGGCDGGGDTAAVVIVVVTTTAAAAVVVAVGRTAAATTALRVSGVGCGGARRRQIAYAAVASLMSTARARHAVGRRRLVQRLELGGHAVVHDVEAHGRQRHAGQYVHGTEPHGHRAGERHLQRPRAAAVADGAEQHEAEEHAVQVRLAAGVQPVQHGRAATDVRRHEREPDQQ